MANLKITELTAYTTPISTDVFPIVDVTTDQTKKITLANLATAINTSINAVTASSTFGTDNVMLRSDGTGRGSQSTGITVGDGNNISYTIANGANVDALTITQSDTTNNKKGIVLAGATSKALLQLTPTGSLGNNAATSGSFLMDYTNATGIAFQLYTNRGSGSLSYPQIYIAAVNTAYDQPLIQLVNNGTSGNACHIRMDGPSPQVEMRETDNPNYQITGAGQFEYQVQGDIFFINGRNYADTSFENMVWFLRASTTDSMNGHVGIGVNPYGIEKLTIGETTGGAARIALKETTAPTADAGYGKLYVKSSDSSLYFMNDSGTEFNLAATATGDVVGPSSSVDNTLVRFDSTSGKLIQGGTVVITDAGAATGFTTINGYYPAYSGADITVGSANCDYTSIQSALDAVGSTGGIVYVSDGTYTITTTLLFKTSGTTLHLSAGAVIQCNGATVTTAIKVNSSAVVRCRLIGGKLLQTNATAQGIGIDATDTTTCYFRDVRIEEFGTAIKMYDTANITFYNSFENIQIFNCNNGVDIGGTLANYHYFKDIRCKLKNGGGGIGLTLVNVQGLTFDHCDWEPSDPTGLTGISIDATCRGNTFINNWIENNAFGVVIASGARETTFIRSTIHNEVGTGTSVTDAGTNTIFLNTDISPASTGGPEVATIRIPKFTDVNGAGLLTLSETASAVNYTTLANAATGNNPTLTATGSDSNIGFNLQAKGTGTYNLLGTASQPAILRLYEDTDDGTNYTSFKVGTQGGSIDYTLPTAVPTLSGQVLTSTTAGVMSWASKYFTLKFSSISSTPAASTTYYFGSSVDHTFSGNTTAALRQEIVPFACTLRGAGITIIGVANSTDTFTIYARINNTTDVTLTSSAAVTTTAQYFSANNLTQAIAAGDKIEIKVVTPAWATPPTAVRILVNLYFE